MNQTALDAFAAGVRMWFDVCVFYDDRRMYPPSHAGCTSLRG